MVEKLGGKFVKIWLEDFVITGDPSVEFEFVGDDLSKNEIEFLEDCMRGDKDIAEYLDLFNFGRGTEFQKNVWKMITSIPRGESWSYKDVAEEIGRPLSFRAVANACSKNPFAFVIPCHRVVGSKGKLGGYFYDKRIKEVLLVWEGM